MKSNPSEYKEIIRKLLERTRQRRVEWEDLGRLSFRCSVGAAERPSRHSIIAGPPDPSDQFFSFVIARAGSDDSQIVLTMRDGNDAEIFRVVSDDLPTSPEEEEISTLLAELYELARRQALKVDEKIESAAALLDRLAI